MTAHRTSVQAIQVLHADVAKAIAGAVKELLEKKHLYQSSAVDIAIARRSAIGLTPMKEREAGLDALVADAETWNWKLEGAETLLEQINRSAAGNPPPEFRWTAPTVKVFCHTCDRLEPFNLDEPTQLLPIRSQRDLPRGDSRGTVQVFALVYRCQSCKGIPEVFLLRRHGTRLTLSGRTPMETVQVNRAIPRQVSKFVSDALVAYQSGQVLAALFLLRTFCEQWCRLFSANTDRADAAIDAYSATLPDDFKARFPSLSSLYGSLSSAIHHATADSALFEVSHMQLVEHFEARRLFKLADPPK